MALQKSAAAWWGFQALRDEAKRDTASGHAKYVIQINHKGARNGSWAILQNIESLKGLLQARKIAAAYA